MRAFAWAFIVCTVLGAVGVFLPSVGVRAGGVSLGRRASMSLYQATTRRDFARKLVIAYHHGAKTRIGGAVVAALSPKFAGRISSYFSDVGDAAKSIGEVADDDVDTVGRILTVTIWVFLALHAIMAAMVFGDAVEGTFRRRRIITALVVAVVVAAVAIAMHVVSREAVAEANDELGVGLLELGAGAYLTPIGALAALGSAIALLVAHVRHGRAGRATAGAPAASGPA